jgi:hypothetical protein
MNPFFKKALPFLLVLATLLPASAQKTITFESTDKSSSKYHKGSHAGEGKNSLTLGVISWFNGYVPVYYERSLLSMLSIQGGIGITTRNFGGDFGTLLESDEESLHFDHSQDIPDDYTHYKFRNTQPGLYLSLSPRVYYDDDIMDGNYIAPLFSYRLNRYSAQMADETVEAIYKDDDRLIQHTSATFSEHIRYLDLGFTWGGVRQNRNHLTIGYSLGLGVRSAKGERLDIGMMEGADGKNHYVNQVYDYDKTKFFMTFNLNVGGWW